MPDFELLTRPFGFLNSRPPGPTTKPEPVAPGTTIYSFGGSGDDAFQLRASQSNEIGEPSDHVELTRKYDVVKVKDPNNDENFIETEVMKEYQARNRIDDSRIKIRFKETEAGGNIEVLKKDQVRNNPAGKN